MPHPSRLLINVISILSKICSRVRGINLGKDNLKSRGLSLIFAYFNSFLDCPPIRMEMGQKGAGAWVP